MVKTEAQPLIQKIAEAKFRQMSELDPALIDGFLFPSAQAATDRTIQLIRELSDSTRGILFNDIDDVSARSERWTRWGFNRFFVENDPEFVPVKLSEVIEAGGRYYHVPRYQDAARSLGRELHEIYVTEVAENEIIHAAMGVSKDILDFQRDLQEAHVPVLGYPTARPKGILRATASWLAMNGFKPAPIIEVAKDSREPHVDKVSFIKRVFTEIPQRLHGKVFLIDDHVPTAILLMQELGGKVIPLVPEVPRNLSGLGELDTLGIRHGKISALAAYALELAA